jgi:RNA polymerase sigma-70 factor, ECF subfamily
MNHDTGQQVLGIGSDPDLFEAFYRRHLDAVSGFVARRVNDPHRAADLTADIFLAAIDASERYSPERGVPGAWLIGIARNVIADDVRQRARERRAVGRIRGRRLLDPDSIARIEERIDAERELRRVYGALDCLAERDRQLFELVALDGLTVADAAQVLGLKPPTARVRLHRARTRLQSQLATALVPVALTEETPS